MVQRSLGNSGKYLNTEWHEKRFEAYTTTFTIDQWSDIAQERYDLTEIEFDRRGKKSYYITEAMVEHEGAAKGGVDLRDVDAIRD